MMGLRALGFGGFGENGGVQGVEMSGKTTTKAVAVHPADPDKDGIPQGTQGHCEGEEESGLQGIA